MKLDPSKGMKLKEGEVTTKYNRRSFDILCECVKCADRHMKNILSKKGWEFAGKGRGYAIQVFEALLAVAKLKLIPQQIQVRNICHKCMSAADESLNSASSNK